MAVYMIRAGEVGPMKIGKAEDPRRRVANLQCGCWERLRLVRVFEGGLKQEKLLHARFRDLHIIGDWFHFSRAMLGDVGLVERAFTTNNRRRGVVEIFRPVVEVPAPIVIERPAAQVLALVEDFLARNTMAPTTFGLRSVKDGKFVSRLRTGKNVTTFNVDRALQFIASHSRQPVAA